MDDTKNAREIMAEEADAAIEPEQNDGLTSEERQQEAEDAQARFDLAMQQAEELQAQQEADDTLRVRREFRQFVAGQVYPALIAKADARAGVREIADNAVSLADELIAALDRAEALDGASGTEQ